MINESEELKKVAAKYAASGFKVLPLWPKKKTPMTKNGLKDASSDPELVANWWTKNPDANIGIATGKESGVTVLDVDGPEGEASLLALVETNGPLPSTVEVRTGRGRHLYFVCPATEVKNSASQIGNKLDIRGEGGYVVAPPSIHENGTRYSGNIDRKALANMPEWLLELLDPKLKSKTKTKTKVKAAKGASQIHSEGTRNSALCKEAGKLRKAGKEVDEILAKLHGFNSNKCDPPLPDDEVERIAQSAEAWEKGSAKRRILKEEFDLFDGTDMGNGARLARAVEGRAAYAGEVKSWYIYDGQRWAIDKTGEIVRIAKSVVESIYEEAAEIEDEEERSALLAHAKRSQSSRAINAMITMAESECFIQMDVFDTNPNVLNLNNGIFLLDKWDFIPHSPEHMRTKIARANFDSDAECPTWLAFLDQITDGNEELIDFLQVVAGYTLSGNIVERCIFILQGSGANGKTTFVNALSYMLGDYALATPIDTLMVKPSGGGSSDIARTMGARLLSTSEGENNQRLGESLVKRITGGDPVVARLLYKDFVEFVPQFKLFLSTNHVPSIKGTDDGVWDRIKLIPFQTRIEAAERDKNLSEKLNAEINGIMWWALQGYSYWQDGGLVLPDIISKSTTEYREQMDVLGGFIEEYCEVTTNGKISSGILYAAYCEWADASGEFKHGKKALGTQLKERGYKNHKSNGTHYWLGLELKPLCQIKGYGA